MSTLDILVDTPALATAHYQRICILVAMAAPDVGMIASLRDALKRLVARGGKDDIGVLFIIGEKSPPPAGEVREAASHLFDDAASRIKVVSVMMGGSGFMAAAKRSVFTWIASRMLGKTPVRTFGRLSEATDWLETKCTELGVSCPTTAELRAAGERLYRP